MSLTMRELTLIDFIDSQMLDHLPFDLRLNTDLFNHLKQSSENSSVLDKASGLSNRYCNVCDALAIFFAHCNQKGVLTTGLRTFRS